MQLSQQSETQIDICVEEAYEDLVLQLRIHDKVVAGVEAERVIRAAIMCGIKHGVRLAMDTLRESDLYTAVERRANGEQKHS